MDLALFGRPGIHVQLGMNTYMDKCRYGMIYRYDKVVQITSVKHKMNTLKIVIIIVVIY